MVSEADNVLEYEAKPPRQTCRALAIAYAPEVLVAFTAVFGLAVSFCVHLRSSGPPFGLFILACWAELLALLLAFFASISSFLRIVQHGFAHQSRGPWIHLLLRLTLCAACLFAGVLIGKWIS